MPDKKNLQPGDNGYIAPVETPNEPVPEVPTGIQPAGDTTPKPDELGTDAPAPFEDNEEYKEAKAKMAVLYPKWNAMTEEEKESADGQNLANEISEVNAVVSKYETPNGVQTPPAQQDPPDTETDNPQAGINNPETAHQENPGKGLPPKYHPITDDDFVAHPQSGVDPNNMQEHAEQTVDKGGRPAGFNEFYAGGHMVNPDNDLLYHLPSDQYDTNANKENR